MEKPDNRKIKRSTLLLILGAVILVLAILAALYGGSLWDLFSSRERIEKVVNDAGAWGPLVLILLQILQVIAAPIPGQVTSLAAGFLYGTVLGSVYSMIGTTIGFTLVIVLSRKLGRPFIEYFVKEKTLKKFDYVADSQGVFIFFLTALLPFFPDDLICFVAGLTKIPIKILVLAVFLGRLPGSILFAFAGEGLADANTGLLVILAMIVLAISAVAWFKRDQLEKLSKKLSKH